MDPEEIKDESVDVAAWRRKFEASFPDKQTIAKNKFRVYDDRYIQRMWLGYLQAKKEDDILIKVFRGIIDGFIVKSNMLSMFVRGDIYGKSGNEKLNTELKELYDWQCKTEDLLEDQEKEDEQPIK